MSAPTLAAFADAGGAGGQVRLVHDTGHVEHHDVTRWLRDADVDDQRLLGPCDGPTLDVGCGPGRLTSALTLRGVPALGVDVCARAVAMTRARGACAIRRDVFARLPGAGRWQWVVVADGNIGIGGDPERLLRRLADLVAPEGGAVVEVSPLDVDHRGSGRMQQPDGTVGSAFPWAVVGARALAAATFGTGWSVADLHEAGERRAVVLRRR